MRSLSRKLGMLALIMALFAVDSSAQSTTQSSQITDQLRRWLSSKTFTTVIRVGGVKLNTSEFIRDMYKNRHYQPLWSSQGQLKSQVYQLINVIKSVEFEGLNPFDYHLFKMVQLLGEINDEEKVHFRNLKVAALDLLLSDAFFTMTADLAFGRVGLDSEIREDYHFDENYDLVYMLEQAVKQEKLSDVIRELRPPHQGFEQMRTFLALYRQLEKSGYWPDLLNRKPMKKGMQNQIGVSALREKLILLGDLKANRENKNVFSEEVEKAVIGYQKRHGLKPDGVVNNKTKEYLNRPLSYYIKKMEINMERWRWLPRDLGERYILVNIPDFTVKVIEKGKVQLSIKCVVGKAYTKTPIFSNRLRYIVINPDWIIPPGLLVRTQLGKIRNQKDYFTRKPLTVLKGWGERTVKIDPSQVNWKEVSAKELIENYRFIQAPGPKNPLGKMKFMFPNEYNVYLHGTNRPDLFEKEVRNYSAGCIRLSRPLDLAAYCIRDHPKWDIKRLEAAEAGSRQQRINLTSSIPIHILYWTAWVDNQGQLQFRQDVYQRDKSIEKAFYQALPSSN